MCFLRFLEIYCITTPETSNLVYILRAWLIESSTSRVCAFQNLIVHCFAGTKHAYMVAKCVSTNFTHFPIIWFISCTKFLFPRLFNSFGYLRPMTKLASYHNILTFYKIKPLFHSIRWSVVRFCLLLFLQSLAYHTLGR